MPIYKYRKFKTGEDFVNKFTEYVERCYERERLVSIAGFLVHAKMCLQTFYNMRDMYPEEFDLIQNMLEDEALNNKTLAPPILLRFLSVKCGYNEKIVTENTNKNTNIDASTLSDEALDKILNAE